MSENKENKVTQKYLRGLLKVQKGKCAITGKRLKPEEMSADHIIPVSRKELNPVNGKTNVWLVDKKVNQFKRTMTYDELIKICRLILENESEARKLQKSISNEFVKDFELNDFLDWVEKNSDENGYLNI